MKVYNVDIEKTKSNRKLHVGTKKLLVFFTIFVNITLSTLILITGKDNALPSALLYLAFMACTIAYAKLISSNEVKPLLFMTMLYWSYAFILPALYQVRNDKYFWASTALSSSYIETASVIAFLATVSLAVGYFLPISIKKNTTPSFITHRHDRVSLFLSSLVLLYCLALVAMFGWESYFLPRELATKIFYQRSGGGSLMAAFGLLAPKSAAIAVLSISLFSMLGGRKNTTVVTSALLAITSNIIINFPLASPRYFLVSIAFALLCTAGMRLFEKYKSYVYVASPIIIYVVFPFLGQWNRGNGLRDGVSSISMTDYLSHGDVDGFQSITNAVMYVDQHGIAWGKQLLSSVLFVVPRTIWSSKSENSGLIAAEEAGYRFLNISMPLPGEFFMDFGIPGALIGVFCLGMLAKKWDLSFKYSVNHLPTTAVYSIIISSFIPIILRGPILSTAQGACVALGICFLWVNTPKIRVNSKSYNYTN